MNASAPETIIVESRLLGDVKLEGWKNEATRTTFMRELESLMERHNVDRIDVCWSRNALLKEAKGGG